MDKKNDTVDVILNKAQPQYLPEATLEGQNWVAQNLSLDCERRQKPHQG